MNFEQMIGFGVAGNFAGHLEQAGEAADFTQVKTENALQPIMTALFVVLMRKKSVKRKTGDRQVKVFQPN